MSGKPLYQEQYCEKHKQPFADFLPQCPICRGEELDGYMKKKKVDETKKES